MVELVTEEERVALTTGRKALNINLDPSKYGTFAEIGAGQEVARWFFKVGGAAGTIAKSMSAYDMKFSDDIYGKAPRYVSKERLLMMLEHEYNLLEERLTETRGKDTTFFVFANTVAAMNYKGTNECHGWMGVRFQLHPMQKPVDMIVHVRMLDESNALQQDAIGIFGVNLIHAAMNLHEDQQKMVKSLAENIGLERLEVDMIECNGEFPQPIDNRILSLRLVQNGLTNAVMFGADGAPLQPSAMLYKKHVLLHRGSFRPFTNVNLDMIQNATSQFVQEDKVDGEVVAIAEITMKNLLSTSESAEVEFDDFLSRVDCINALGYPVLVSNYFEYYRLSAYINRYTKGMVGIIIGINALLEIFNEEYYQHLDGGILESIGRLFKNQVKLYVYPMTGMSYTKFLELNHKNKRIKKSSDFAGDILITAKNLQVDSHLRNLYAHLLENNYIEPITNFNSEVMNIFSRQVIQKIRNCEKDWEGLVPEKVVQIIKERHLWGFEG